MASHVSKNTCEVSLIKCNNYQNRSKQSLFFLTYLFFFRSELGKQQRRLGVRCVACRLSLTKSLTSTYSSFIFTVKIRACYRWIHHIVSSSFLIQTPKFFDSLRAATILNAGTGKPEYSLRRFRAFCYLSSTPLGCPPSCTRLLLQILKVKMFSNNNIEWDCQSET